MRAKSNIPANYECVKPPVLSEKEPRPSFGRLGCLETVLIRATEHTAERETLQRAAYGRKDLICPMFFLVLRLPYIRVKFHQAHFGISGFQSKAIKQRGY